MKSLLAFVVYLTLTIGALAASVRRDAPAKCCSFSLAAKGSPNGTVNEDIVGENQLLGASPKGEYCFLNTTLIDNQGRTCFMISPADQFVCDVNNTPTTSRFTLSADNNLLYNGSPYYYACPYTGRGSDGSYNIYSDKLSNTTGCTNITLSAGGFSCAALGRPSSTLVTSTATPAAASTATPSETTNAAVASSATTPTGGSTTTTTASCPTDISSGTFIAPNLIIPVSPSSPTTSFGTQYSATITPLNSTLFAFDIPPTYPSTCSLLFLFPYANRAQFPYSFSGIEQESVHHGGLDFALLNGAVDNSTTFATVPAVGEEYGTLMVYPGNNYTVVKVACRGGERVSYEVKSVNGTALQYFQSTGASPIGLYVVPCS
jgi:hypothetical protein